MPRCHGLEVACATSKPDADFGCDLSHWQEDQAIAAVGTVGSRRQSSFLIVAEDAGWPMQTSKVKSNNFLCAPRTSFNYTVEEAAHHAQHANEDALAMKKALAKDHSMTAQEARFFSMLSTPLTFLTSTFAITAAYLEVQNGWMLAQKAKMLKEDIAHGAPREH
mmetsp:Transcript_134967/g.190829  ORF Transcript_134967/g.190829 Transcript_134967/m.190829 type:complete len:164 (+) Transcript_134967:50-541(+)